MIKKFIVPERKLDVIQYNGSNGEEIQLFLGELVVNMDTLQDDEGKSYLQFFGEPFDVLYAYKLDYIVRRTEAKHKNKWSVWTENYLLKECKEVK